MTGQDHLRPALIAVALVAAVAAMLGLQARATHGAQTTADEPYYLLTAQSLADDRDLDIAEELDQRAYEPYHAIAIDPQTTPLGDDGRRLAPHDPLLPLLLAPAMWLGGWVAAKAFLVLLAGLTAALTVWLAVRRVEVSTWSAALVVGGLSAGMPLAPYGTQVYPELPAALVVLIAVAAISSIVPDRLRPRRHAVIGAGICAAIVALPWLSVKYVPVAGVLSLVAGSRFWATGHRRTAIVGAGVLALAGVAYLLIHQAVYGGWTVYAAGDHFVGTGELSVVGVDPSYLGRSRRIVGLLVDRSFGIGTWAPAWLLAPAAAMSLVVTRHPQRWLLLGPIAAAWATATFMALTMHGWWVPGRQLVIALPLVAIAIADLLDRLPALRRPTSLALLAGASSWTWLAIEAMTGRRTLVVDMDQTAAPAYRLLARIMPDGLAATATDDLGLLAWFLVLAASALLTARALPRQSHVPGSPRATAPDAAPDAPSLRTAR